MATVLPNDASTYCNPSRQEETHTVYTGSLHAEVSSMHCMPSQTTDGT